MVPAVVAIATPAGVTNVKPTTMVECVKLLFIAETLYSVPVVYPVIVPVPASVPVTLTESPTVIAVSAHRNDPVVLMTSNVPDFLVYVTPVGVPTVVTIATFAVVVNVNVVVPFVAEILYSVPIVYPVIVPVPPNVPVIETMSPTANVDAAQENAPAVFVIATPVNLLLVNTLLLITFAECVLRS